MVRIRKRRVPIQVVNHGCQRGTLTAARRARHQHESPFGFRNLRDRFRQAERLQGRYLQWDVSKRQAERSALVEHVDSKPRELRIDVGKIGAPLANDLLPHVIVGDLADNRIHVFGGAGRKLQRE